MFAPLPNNFSQLQKLVETMNIVTIIAPPPIKSIGIRLRILFEQAQKNNYSNLTSSELRKLPFAYWVTGYDPLPIVDPELVKNYWEQYLPYSINNSLRCDKRWLTPQFFAYCESFNQKDTLFLDFAFHVRNTISYSKGNFSEKLKYLQKEVRFFDPTEVASRLANALLLQQNSKSLDNALSHYLLWPGFLNTLLGDAVFDAALAISPELLRQPIVILRLLEWVYKLPAPVQKSKYKVAFANALLKPWYRKKPPEKIKSQLVDFFIKSYGDPRITRFRQYQWKNIDPEALSVMMNLLAGDTLRGFINILERTADKTWHYRQKFWMAYYDKGYIEEAWLALGVEGQAFANTLHSQERGIGFSRLESGVKKNQSVLLLKIGHIVFTEWSHDGSLRAYHDGDTKTPCLYQDIYYGENLRAPISIDFHDGANDRPALRHSHSDKGTWQRKARDFIRREIGVYLSDWDIL